MLDTFWWANFHRRVSLGDISTPRKDGFNILVAYLGFFQVRRNVGICACVISQFSPSSTPVLRTNSGLLSLQTIRLGLCIYFSLSSSVSVNLY